MGSGMNGVREFSIGTVQSTHSTATVGVLGSHRRGFSLALFTNADDVKGSWYTPYTRFLFWAGIRSEKGGGNPRLVVVPRMLGSWGSLLI